MPTIAAAPYPYELPVHGLALMVIDMQRDFLEPGGFGEMLGNDVSQLRRTIEPNRKLLAAWRKAGHPTPPKGGLVLKLHGRTFGLDEAGKIYPFPYCASPMLDFLWLTEGAPPLEDAALARAVAEGPE